MRIVAGRYGVGGLRSSRRESSGPVLRVMHLVFCGCIYTYALNAVISSLVLNRIVVYRLDAEGGEVAFVHALYVLFVSNTASSSMASPGQSTSLHLAFQQDPKPCMDNTAEGTIPSLHPYAA